MAGTMSGFWVGTSGLQSGQYALNTTAHNITNSGTAGYSRQQVLFTDMAYSRLGFTARGINQVGLGTRIGDVRLIRDRLIDKNYRKQFGREQYYQSKYEVVSEVQNYFGELESSSFRKSMMKLWESAEELQKESNDIVKRTAYIASAVTFVEQANEIYSQLVTYQKNLNTEIEDQVARINELAETIYDLNNKITAVEAAGIESANDYRDQRDAALDELAGLVSITYHENSNGQVDVYAEHRTLVSMDRIYKMGTKAASDSCDYLVPIWEDDQDNVFNMHYDEAKNPRNNPNGYTVTTPNAGAETDTGSLKGLVMSRGDWIANYTDIPIAPKREDYADDTAYVAAVVQYNNEKSFYNTYLEPYTVNNIIAQFDQLVHGIVTKINDILCPNKEITIQVPDPDDPTQTITKTVKVLDEENAGYGMGEDNRVQGTELFKRRIVDRYTEQTVTVVNEDGTTSQMTVQLCNEENESDYLSLYTLGNLEVNDALLKNPSLLPLSNLQQEELQTVADQLITIWEKDFATLGPNSPNNFMEYYREFIGDFANKGNTYAGIADTQQLAVQELENQRQSVVGVSTDEELSNMIKYQQGYNAASRYFTVVSEMVEHLISKLG